MGALSPLAPSNPKYVQHLDAAGEFTMLGDLQPTADTTVGYGELMTGRAWWSQGFHIRGQEFDNGVFAHAPSDVHYHLGKKFKVLKGCVGLDDHNGRRDFDAKAAAFSNHQCARDAAKAGVKLDGVRFEIIADGNTIWSHRYNNGDKATCFTVSVSGVAKMQLKADDIDNKFCDEAAWVGVKLYEDPIVQCERLGDLRPNHQSVGYEDPLQKKTWYNHGHKINGVPYDSGLFVHAVSKIVFPLHAKYDTFHGCAGLDDQNTNCLSGASFSVKADYKQMWAGAMVKGEAAACFSVSVANAFALTLTTKKHDAQSQCDIAEWVNADVCKVVTHAKTDCKVAEKWGEWTKCSRNCNTGYQSRKRAIEVYPSGGGKSCPRTHEVRRCNESPCPIDCKVQTFANGAAWSPSRTSTCSRRCGGGQKKWFRSVVTPPAFGGKACPPLTRTTPCNLLAGSRSDTADAPCPVDCVATPGACHETTEYKWAPRGSHWRDTRCGKKSTKFECEEAKCTWSWEPWSACSTSCGGGIQKRKLVIVVPASNGGKACPAKLEKQRQCSESYTKNYVENCPIDCIPGDWSPWGKCTGHPDAKSETGKCGGGIQERTRSMKRQGLNGGLSCNKYDTTQTRQCDTKPCPVDCKLGPEPKWGTCRRVFARDTTHSGEPSKKKDMIAGFDQSEHWGREVTCGGGMQVRRWTIAVPAMHGGKACPSLIETKICAKEKCPFDCQYSNWGSRSACDQTCNVPGGRQGMSYTRRTVVKKANKTGKQCDEEPRERSFLCKGLMDCPVDCKMSDYGTWQAGGVLGGCVQGEERTNPKTGKKEMWPKNDGAQVKCGGGVQTRSKQVLTPANLTGKQCPSNEWWNRERTEVRGCNDFPCPIDCELTAWSSWSTCTAECGGGWRSRSKSITRVAQWGGQECRGLGRFEQERCNTHVCPMKCEYTQWSNWGSCSTSCGTAGIRRRHRSVAQDNHHSSCASLNGGVSEEAPCNRKVVCPVDCRAHAWGTYSDCSRTCGFGTQTRRRTIDRENSAGKPCLEADGRKSQETDVRRCNAGPCNDHCDVGRWNDWGSCTRKDKTVTCGGGVQTRTRSTQWIRDAKDKDGARAISDADRGWPDYVHVLPEDANGHKICSRRCRKGQPCGKSCIDASDTCRKSPERDDWTACDAETATRLEAEAQGRAPQGRTQCPFSKQVRECALEPCAVDCEVTKWYSWGSCTRSCGTGWRKRVRTIKVNRVGSGLECPGLHQVESCSHNACPLDCVMKPWGAWGHVNNHEVRNDAASTCSAKCGGGEQVRTRSIDPRHPGNEFGKPCSPVDIQTRSCNSHNCPVDCNMNVKTWVWTDAEKCSKECGGGKKNQVRRQQPGTPAYGGKPCRKSHRIVSCNTHLCPIDCKMTRWSEWTPCTKSCTPRSAGVARPSAGGTRSRRRAIDTMPQNGGAQCPKDRRGRFILVETENCGGQWCPEHCEVSSWGQWGGCDKDCRRKVNAQADPFAESSYEPAGKRVRSREVLRFSQFGGYSCPSLEDASECGTDKCPQDCVLHQWSGWGWEGTKDSKATFRDLKNPQLRCSAKCGGGRQTRTRYPLHNQQALFGGSKCASKQQWRACNTHNCPVDCKYGKLGWGNVDGEWSPCSRKCGGGIRQQRRQILVSPAFGGKPCPSSVVVESCPNGEGGEPCPVDCQMSAWGWWSPCTKSCGGGKRTRERKMLVPRSGNGKTCGSNSEKGNCNAQPCPIDCEANAWGTFTHCSAACGLGKHIRKRTFKAQKKCPNGETSCYGGATCGAPTDERNCQLKPCAVDCVTGYNGKPGRWGFGGRVDQWSQCNADCGGGTKIRKQEVIIAPDFGGKQCGPIEEERPCNTHKCPVHCMVTDFADWTPCSRSCGNGIMTRKRTVHQRSLHGGRGCPPLTEARVCNTNPCPIDCEVSAFAAWKPCSKTCGMGFRFRTRKVVRRAAKGGAECPALTETGFCNEQKCPVNCEASSWGEWSQCSTSCGDGRNVRRRKITRQASNGGLPCGMDLPLEQRRNPEVESRPCFVESCPIDCEVDRNSGAYGNCKDKKTFEDLTCGAGVRVKKLAITQRAGPKGLSCEDLTSKWAGATGKCDGDYCYFHDACDLGECPVHCTMSPWTMWTACSKKCRKLDGNAGRQTRTRTIVDKGNGLGVQCGAERDTRTCNDHPCAVDCKVDKKWGAWGGCSKSCGAGVQIRRRSVLVKPMYGGERCPALAQTKSCNTQSCPRDCLLGKWSDWSQCTKSCNSGDAGPGTWFATRKVLREAAFNGAACKIEPGTTLTKKVNNCNDRPCPIDCAVSRWTATDGTRGIWSKCSRSCAAVLQEHSALKDIANAKKGTNALAFHSRQRQRQAITAERLSGRPLPAGMKLKNGVVVDAKNAPVYKLFGGRGCPHVFEKEHCNSYTECMKLFMGSSSTTVEHEKRDWKKLLEKTSTKDTLTNGVAKATTPPPTPITTPEPIITTPDQCVMKSGAETKTLPHGWHGAGIGSNWCNLCRCNDGAISCQKRKCGTDGLMRGTECSHTTCHLDDSGDHTLVIVQHSHQENFGRHHHCAYMPGHDTNCRCHCFGNTFKELQHGTVGAFNTGNDGVRRDADLGRKSAGGQQKDAEGNDIQRFAEKPSAEWSQK